MPDSSVYKQLTVEAAAALADSGNADFAVYLPSTESDEVVLYRAMGKGLRRPDYHRLRERGISTLYVQTNELLEQQANLEANFLDLMQATGLGPVAKADIAHHVGQSVAQGLVEDPTSPQSLDRTVRFLDNMVECIIANPAVAPYLAHMASHHRSTASHMIIVSSLAMLLGTKVFGEKREALRDVGLAGMLHDFGKLAIDPDVLNKPSALSQEELVAVQQHPIESVRLFADNPNLSPQVRRIVIQHHERIDGRGYPLGLRGEEIDIGSRILAIADSFHAITGPRPYRAPMTPAEANRVLELSSGRQFDADLVACWNAVSSLQGELPPREWAVRGSARAQDSLAAEHEHRAQGAQKSDIRYRPRRFLCNGRTDAVCVYAGRLPSVTSAPRTFVCPVHDLSQAGACLRSDHPLFRGEVVHVQVRSREQAVWVEGVVAWCRRREQNDGFHFGVRFATRIREDQVGRHAEVEGMEPKHKIILPG